MSLGMYVMTSDDYVSFKTCWESKWKYDKFPPTDFSSGRCLDPDKQVPSAVSCDMYKETKLIWLRYSNALHLNWFTLYSSLQIFAIELVSYLGQQFALPKSLGIAKLALSVMSTLLGGKNTCKCMCVVFILSVLDNELCRWYFYTMFPFSNVTRITARILPTDPSSISKDL